MKSTYFTAKTHSARMSAATLPFTTAPVQFWLFFVCCAAYFACILSNKICFIPLTTRRSFTFWTCASRILKSWHNYKSSSLSKLTFMMAATYFSNVMLACYNSLSMSFLKFISIKSSLKSWNIAATEKCFWLILVFKFCPYGISNWFYQVHCVFTNKKDIKSSNGNIRFGFM